jgi:hypothetical protein
MRTNEGGEMKERIKKFFNDHDDTIVKASIVTLTGLVAILVYKDAVGANIEKVGHHVGEDGVQFIEVLLKSGASKTYHHK